MTIRIGHGYDVHAFTEGSEIILGGVQIKHHQAFLAHSDGDVLIHAVCDALLGALALGDIGHHFPDNDQRFKNIDSRVLLRDVIEKIRSRGYSLGNLDITIVAQAPKISPHITAMRHHLAADFGGIDLDRINIKATTTEKLGFTGRQEGIACHAVCLLQKSHSPD